MVWKKVFLLILLCCGYAMNSASGKENSKGNTYAVVVGIAQYKNPDMPALRFADKDATLFAAYLESETGGNVPVSNIKLLLNETATIAAIYDALNWLQRHCTANDKAYFYFSGHGDVETKNKFSLGYLLAYNSPPNNYRNNAITIEDINKVANHLSIKNNATVVLVTDACHSGKLAGDYYKGNQLVASQLKWVLNNEVRMAACGVDEKAAEGEDWGGGRGIFSYYLLKGLNGMADLNKNDTIQLAELNTYLDSSFAVDKILIRNTHKQRPALDGNPYQTMAIRNASTENVWVEEISKLKTDDQIKSVLTTFKPLGVQPVDYLFDIMKTKAIENKLIFSNYEKIPKDSLPLTIIRDCIGYQLELNRLKDSLGIGDYNDRIASYTFVNIDTLLLLKDQLSKSRVIVSNFNERFIQMVHGLAQDMINEYLEGDIAELEKRQYYYAGNRRYKDFLNMLRLTVKIAPEDHYLYPLLSVQEPYISGLVARLEMVKTSKVPALLADAFRYQQKAMKREPYAAYVHNEIGNLYFRNNNYAKAGYHFDMAKQLSPTWSIPWSNEIRLGLATKNLKKAVAAIKKADSLQNDLPYIMMNAGLVMEQKGDLLTAESYFQKAIAKNNVHFLPYERLGNLYLRTGEYEKADWALAASSMRKKDFNINEKSFTYGNELGGPDTGSEWQFPRCHLSGLEKSAALRPYILLSKSFQLAGVNPDSAVLIMRDIFSEMGDIPLRDHYMGKALFKLNNWKDAEPWLLRALGSYQSDSVLSGKSIYEYLVQKNITDSCLLANLRSYEYDRLEDFYLLAGVYEKLGIIDKAIEKYTIITKIENTRQWDQATFKYKNSGKSPGISPDTLNELFVTGEYGFRSDLAHQYEAPLRMTGYIKLGRAYERSGHYLQAEKVYLQQVEQNQNAAKARKESISRINFYALMINRLAEAETFDFYQRMLRLFPRDSDWQEKSGLFLYRRLSLIFQKVPADRYEAAYKSMNEYAYPFLLADETGTLEGSQRETLELQGTGEKVVINTPKYDPVKVALGNLKQALRLSGELKPKPQLLEGIADLNSWMGNRKEAFEIYKELIKIQEPDARLRTKIINYCFVIYELPFAIGQLEILNRDGQATQSQRLQLANGYASSGLTAKSLATLHKIYPVNEDQKVAIATTYAKVNWLSGKYAAALKYMSEPFDKLNATEPDSLKTTASRYYSIARLNGFLKQNDKAMIALEKALENGFFYKFVLDEDPVWNALRLSGRWKKLKMRYSNQLQSDRYQGNLLEWYPVLDYKMPY